MANVKVKLLRPLDGVSVEDGKSVEYPEADAKRLAEYGAVQIVGGGKAETKAEAAAPANKMDAAPANKAATAPITAPAAKERVTPLNTVRPARKAK